MKTYLLVSETNYFIKEKLKELTNNITNIITFNLEFNTLDEVLEEASYFSMFNDEKCLIVKNATFFSAKKKETNKNKEDTDKLIEYLNNPNPCVTLIFITDSIDSKKKVCNILKDNTFIYPKLKRTYMKNELQKIVNQKGYKIDDNSLWYIINNSLGNFDIAINEINKIFMYYNKKGNIEYFDVMKLTSKTYEENNFKLVDSIIARDLDLSLQYLDEAKTMGIEPNVIISLLYREFKLMLSTLLYENKHINQNEILSNLKLAPWQYEKVRNNLRNYKIWEIKDEIKYLSNIDYEIKSGLINIDIILIKYIYHLC